MLDGIATGGKVTNEVQILALEVEILRVLIDGNRLRGGKGFFSELAGSSQLTFDAMEKAERAQHFPELRGVASQAAQLMSAAQRSPTLLALCPLDDAKHSTKDKPESDFLQVALPPLRQSHQQLQPSRDRGLGLLIFHT